MMLSCSGGRMRSRPEAVGAFLVTLILVQTGCGATAEADAPSRGQALPVDHVIPPPADVVARLELKPFYSKHVSVDGLPIVGSAKVSDYALLETAYLVRRMLGSRPDIVKAMAAAKVRVVVMAASEFTTDVPEHSDLKPPGFWDRRARGLGATKWRPAVSSGEENLLCYKGDPYAAENIFIHEFAHTIHGMGMNVVDPTFDSRLGSAYKAAMAKGLWKDKYAANNRSEYWAEAVQSWFDTNRKPDHDHNHVDTREELVEYDPALARLVAEVLGRGPWRYRRPAEREAPGHIEGYDASSAPRFVWPERVQEAWREHQRLKKEKERKKKR